MKYVFTVIAVTAAIGDALTEFCHEWFHLPSVRGFDRLQLAGFPALPALDDETVNAFLIALVVVTTWAVCCLTSIIVLPS